MVSRFLILFGALIFSLAAQAADFTSDVQVGFITDEAQFNKILSEVGPQTGQLDINGQSFAQHTNAKGETTLVTTTSHYQAVASNGGVFFFGPSQREVLEDQGLFNVGAAVGWLRYSPGKNLDSDNGPVFSVRAGLRPPFYRHLEVGAEYNFRNLGSFDLPQGYGVTTDRIGATDTILTGTKTLYGSHDVLAFGDSFYGVHRFSVGYFHSFFNLTIGTLKVRQKETINKEIMKEAYVEEVKTATSEGGLFVMYDWMGSVDPGTLGLRFKFEKGLFKSRGAVGGHQMRLTVGFNWSFGFSGR